MLVLFKELLQNFNHTLVLSLIAQHKFGDHENKMKDF